MAKLGQWRALALEIRREQDALLQDADLSQVRARLLETGRKERNSSSLGGRTGVLVGAAIVLATILVLQPSQQALTFVVNEQRQEGQLDTWISSSDVKSVPVKFSDGTQVHLSPSTRARVVHIDERGAHLVLESGQAQFDVQRRKGSAWAVSTGPFRVNVEGTSFDLSWDPATGRFGLILFEGQVNVSGCLFGSEGRKVRSGESLTANCDEDRFELTQHDGDRSTGPNPVADESRRAPPPVAGSIGTTPPKREGVDRRERQMLTGPASPPKRAATTEQLVPRWRTLLTENKHQAAYEEARQLDFSLVCQGASLGELSHLADAARFAGDTKRASLAYQAIRSRFAGTSRAAHSAFVLGRIAFDQAADYPAAIRWFRTYLNEQPGGGLAVEAHGRLMESYHRSGSRKLAKESAQSYLKRHPDGSHAQLARQISGAPARANSLQR